MATSSKSARARAPAPASVAERSSEVTRRSLVIKENPQQVFERDRRNNTLSTTVALPEGCQLDKESGTFAFLPQLQTVTLQLYLVHCDDTSKRVVSTDMEPMVEMLLNEEEVVTACLGPDKRECTIPFRVNILSGKRLFRLAIEPHAPDALTKDGSLLIAGYTTPFRVVTKATTKKPKVDAGVAGVAGVSGVSGVSGVAGMAAKRKREDASPTSLTSMSSPRVKRARGEEESEESEVESGDEPEEEDLRGTVASIARNVHHMLKMVSVVAQQQAGLARIVTDHLALVSAPVSAPAAVAAVVAVKT